MDWQDKLRGFYAIIDRIDDRLIGDLLAAANVLQVRVKGDSSELARVAAWAREQTKETGALLVVNDSVDIAVSVGADAVHLGQDDQALESARKRVGSSMLVGVSTHNIEQVRAGVVGGADYLGYGPVFATSTKENADQVQGLEALRCAVEAAAPVPVVAIGGIGLGTIAQVAQTGAWSAAAIASVNGASSTRSAGETIARALR